MPSADGMAQRESASTTCISVMDSSRGQIWKLWLKKKKKKQAQRENKWLQTQLEHSVNVGLKGK